MMTGKLSTFIMNGWDVETIWQRCQGAVSAIGRIAESSRLYAIKQRNFGRFSLLITTQPVTPSPTWLGKSIRSILVIANDARTQWFSNTVIVNSGGSLINGSTSSSYKAILLFLLISFGFLTQLMGQTTGDFRTTGIGAKNWNTLTTWQYYNGSAWVTPSGTSPQGYPGQFTGTGTVTITNNVQLTLNVSLSNAIGALLFPAGTTLATTLSISDFSLNVTGAVTLNNPGGTSGDQTLTVGTGTLYCASLALANTDSGNEDLIVSLSTGTINVTGNVTMSGSTTENAITFSGSGSLNIGGNMTGTGTFTASTSTVTYSGTSPIIYGTTYYNLAFTGSGTTGNPTGNIALNGNLTNTGSTVLNFSTRSVTISGTLAAQSIAGFTNTTPGTVTITKTSGTATFTSAVNGYRLTMSGIGGTLNLGTELTHTFTDRWTRTNGTLNGGSSTLRIGGSVSGTGGTFTAGTGTVEWYGVNQTIAGLTYNNLVISGSGTKTMAATSTINGNLTINGGVLYDGGRQITGNSTGTLSMAAGTGLTLGSTTVATTFPTNFTSGNTSLSPTSTVTYNSNMAQTISAVPSYGNLTLIATAAITKTAAGNIGVNGNLTIGTNNTLSGGANLITVKGNVANSGTYSSSGAGKLLLTGGTAVHAISGGTSNFGNLELDDPLGATFTGAGTTTITGNLNVTTGTLTTNAFTTALYVNGTTTIGGSLIINSATGAKRFSGLVTINNGGSWTNLLSASNFRGGITNNGSFSGGTGINTFETSSQALNGTPTLFSFGGQVTISGTINLTNNTSVTIAGNIIGTAAGSTWINAANSTLNAGNGVLTTGTLTANASGNTVNYMGAVQTVKPTSTYHNLSLTGSNTKSLSTTTTTINGNLTLGGTASATGVTGLTIGGNVTLGSGTTFANGTFTHNVAGDWTNNGAIYTPGTGTLNFNNTAIDQTIGGTATSQTFNNLTVAKSTRTLNLGGSTSLVTVGAVLNMTSGNINTGSGTIQLGTSTAAVGTFTYSNGTIIGGFKRWINAAGTINFPVGTASNKQNAQVILSSVVPGSLTTRFIASNPGNTGLPLTENSLAIENQFTEGYWSMVAGDGLSSSNYALNLSGTGFSSYIQDSEIRIIKRPNGGGSWSLNGTHVAGTPPVASRSGLSGFGEFAHAKPKPFPTVNFTTSTQSSVGESGIMNITAQLSATTLFNVSVPFTVTIASTATAGTDYTISASPLVIPAGSTSGNIVITIVVDPNDEPNETVVVNMGIPTYATQGTTITHTATITDDDNPPTVSFTAASQSSANESGTVTITAQLSASSAFSVTVPFTLNGLSTATGGGTDYSISSSPLNISAGNSSANITLTLNNDLLIEGNETVIVNMGTPTNATTGAITTHTVSITDDEAPPVANFTTSSQSSANESGTMTITVQLSAISTLNVTVPFTINVSSTATGAGTDYSISASPVTINAGSTTGTITITISPDNIDEANETIVVNMGTPTNATLGTTTTHTATISDDDTAGFTVNPTAGLVTTESSGTATFTVKLNSQPGADVTISISSDDTSEGTVSPASLTFTTANWASEQTVTVTGVDGPMADGNIVYHIVTGASVSSDTNYSGLNPPDVEVTNNDNDAIGISVNPTTISTTEASGSGQTATFTILLNTQPTANVTIGISSSNTNEATVSPSSVTFTDVNWNTAQTIAVTGVNDFVDDGNQPYTIATATATGGDYNGFNATDVSGTNIDDDTKGITVGAISGNTTEAGGTATFTIQLNSQPTSNVSIGISSLNTNEGTVLPSSVTFTSVNWNSPQTVTVTGVNDFIDDGDISYTIVLAAATGGDYAGIDVADVTVINSDDDTRGFTLSSINGNTTEAGVTATFTLKLNSQPTANVSIGLSSSNTSEGTVLPTSLTFTTSNWNTDRLITVTGVNDDIDDGDITFQVITASATGGDYATLNPPDVDVINQDNDIAGFTVSPTSGLTTTEAGGTATFTIKLNSQPTADVIIALTSGDLTEGSVSPSSLTFTSGNWNTTQTVTITGLNDFMVDGNIGYSIITEPAISSDLIYNGLDPENVSVTNTDNDVAGITVSPTSGLTTTEAGGTAQFNIILTSQPTADVIIGLSSSDTSESDVSPSSVTFTSVNWNVSQEISVIGANDFLIDGPISYSIITTAASSSDPNYSGFFVADVSVTNTDDDVAGFTITPISGLETSEDGTPANFTIKLNAIPTANVTIGITSNNINEGTVSPASVIFTPSDWDTEKTITITGVNDFVDDGDIAYTILTAAAVSTDVHFNGLNPSDVTVTNIDDDAKGITVSPISGSTSESGGTATFTIVLDSQPTANATIGLSSDDSTEGTVSPTSVVFTTANWSTPKEITVTGVDDQVDDGDITYNIVIASSTGGDYAGINADDVEVVNLNNDIAGISITPTSGTTTESGGAVMFSVVLTSQPANNVTITIGSDNTDEGTVSPGSLTFNTSNWGSLKTFTVTGVDDALIDGPVNYEVTATSSSDDPLYSGVDVILNMTNTDNDNAGVIINPLSGLVTTESGGTATFTVKLATQPESSVSIGFSSGNTSEGTISPSSLTFTTANWNTDQNITITGVNDVIADGNVAYTIISNSATSSDPDYNNLDPDDVSVTNTDLTPTIGSFLPAQVCYSMGSSIVVSGSKYINITSVTINGLSASYTVDNQSHLTVTLPATATTGPISVVTQTGSAISGSSITVNPLPTATISGTTTVCKDAVSPIITFTGADGLAPYAFTYTINGGSPLQISTSSGNSVTVQAPVSATGTYNYTLNSVSDANTCSHLQTGSAIVSVSALVHTNQIQLE